MNRSSSSDATSVGDMSCSLSSDSHSLSVERAEALVVMVTAIPQTILKLAECIETDILQVARWFEDDPISILGGCTAKDLVASGKDEAVLNFLRAVTRDEN